MTSLIGEVTEVIARQEATSERANRHELTASDLYACTAQQIYDLRRIPRSSPRVSWPAVVGSAIHARLESVWPLIDPDAIIERRFEYRGVTCTVDAVLPARRLLIDVKTVRDDDAVTARALSPGAQTLAQIQVGAAAVRAAGVPVDEVALLVVPRSGRWDSARLAGPWPFDAAAADDAVSWADRVRTLAASDAEPTEHRERPPGWCGSYCEWSGLCRPESAQDQDLTRWEPQVAEYVAAGEQERAAKARRAELAAELFGLTGRVGPWHVRTVPDSVSTRLDVDAVEAMAEAYEFVTGSPLPTRLVSRRGYVSVSRAR